MTKVLIETAGTEFEQNGKPYAIIDNSFREGKPIMLDAEDIEAVAPTPTPTPTPTATPEPTPEPTETPEVTPTPTPTPTEGD